MADIDRRLRALDQIEQRELDSLHQARRREQRQRINARHEHMPAVVPAPIRQEQTAPPVQPTAPPETALARQMAEAAQLLKQPRNPVRLRSAFARAADTDDGGGESGDTGTAEPSRKRRRTKRVRACSTLRREFGQAASSGEQGEGEAGGESAEAPKPAAEPPRRRRRRRKRKSRDGPADGDRRRDQDKHENGPQDDAEQKERQRRRRRRRDFKLGP